VALTRRVETFSAGYFGTHSEATVFTDLPMLDMDNPPARQNFALADRRKQYLSLTDPIAVKVNAIVQSTANYVSQRLGAMARFLNPLASSAEAPNPTVAPASAVAGSAGTLLAGTYLVGYTWTGVNGESELSPTASVTTTGTTGSISGGTAPSLVAPATGTNWYVSTNGGDVTTMRLVGAGTGVNMPVVTAVPAAPGTSPPTFDAVTLVTMSATYIPMYFLKGARAIGNARTAAKIDTTGSGDLYMNGVPARPDATISFSLVTGAKVTNKAGNLIAIEDMLVGAANGGTACVFAFVDDTTDPLQPRDAMYAFVGTASKTRPMAGAVERAIQGYLAVPDDQSLPLVSISYIA
jgi:hypothetical protein